MTFCSKTWNLHRCTVDIMCPRTRASIVHEFLKNWWWCGIIDLDYRVRVRRSLAENIHDVDDLCVGFLLS